MFRPVLQHVNESIPDLARRPQGPRVEPISPDATTPPEDPVQGLRKADREPLKPAREGTGIQRLYE